jgi:hypothetical protein
MLAKSGNDAGWAMFLFLIFYEAAKCRQEGDPGRPMGYQSDVSVRKSCCPRPSRIVGTIALLADCLQVAIMFLRA